MTLCRTTGIDVIDWLRLILSSMWVLTNLKYWLISWITPTLWLPSRLYLTLVTYYTTTGQNPRREIDEISWKNEELVTLLYWDTWESWCAPPLALPKTPLQLAHIISVWETDPPDVSLAISLGRQLEGGADSWRGAEGAGLAVTFGWVGGFVGWDIFRSHVQCFRVSYDIPQSQYKICSELFLKRETTVSVRFSSLTPSFTEILSNSSTARVCNISHRL